MRVFVKGNPVRIHDLCNVLTGAVIEMQFKLHHFPIQQKNVDSFNASIQQIQVIQPGEMRPQTAVKRQSMSEGPIEVAESILPPCDDPAPMKKKPRMLEVTKEGHNGEEKGSFHMKHLHRN